MRGNRHQDLTNRPEGQKATDPDGTRQSSIQESEKRKKTFRYGNKDRILDHGLVTSQGFETRHHLALDR